MKTYASFFEWHDKGLKELGVVEELIVALNKGAGLSLSSPREFSPDPPDCVAVDEAGQLIAIEVAEVVCERATRLTAQGHKVYREWQRGELTDHVARELADKDSKVFHGGPYVRTILCLFTDEPALSVDFARKELEDRVFGPLRQLTEAYLLFSYQPVTQTYPIIRLRIANDA